MNLLDFSSLSLSQEIQKAVAGMGFKEATPIQSKAIPYLLEGKDLIGQAQTGTGKTAAFGIPILEMVDPDCRKLQALILCPTRELAVQVSEEMKKLSKYKKGIEILPVYGGQPIERQLNILKKGVQIVIGTPGRVMDHIDRRTLKLDSLKTVVLDEADEMLDMGFREDIEIILQKTPKEKQMILFSATMPQSILNLTHKYQNSPQFIKVVPKEMTVPGTEQFYYELKERTKLETLINLVELNNLNLSLVFCNTKKRVDELVEKLQLSGCPAEGLHGDMRQAQRDNVMAKFRNGTLRILVATDVAARGIDVEGIEAVFNYDVPNDEEAYVHRIGRTGRAGKKGKAFTLVTSRELGKVKNIQKFTHTKIKHEKAPSLRDVQKHKTEQLKEKIKNTINEGLLGKYLHFAEELVKENYSPLDITAGVLKLLIEKDNKENNGIDKIPAEKSATNGMIRLFINTGRNHKIMPRDIIRKIMDETDIEGKEIGAIDIYDNFSFLEVPGNHAENIMSSMKNKKIKGRIIKIEPANKRQELRKS